MIPPMRWMQKQYLVYWEYDGAGQYASNYKTPVELKVRWEDVQEEMVGPDGIKFIATGHIMARQPLVLLSCVVFLVDPDRIASVDTSKTPQQLRALKIQKTGTLPNLSAKRALYEGWT